MAYKCKVCGYRFKSSDKYVCPECFTARDDMNFDAYVDSNAYNEEIGREVENDFITNEIREEQRKDAKHKKRVQQQNKAYQNNVNSTNTPYSSGIQSNYNGGNSTLRYTTSFNPNTTNPNAAPNNFTYNRSINTTYSTASSNINANLKGLKVVVAMFIAIFAIIILTTIYTTVTSILDSNDYEYSEDDFYSNYDGSYSAYSVETETSVYIDDMMLCMEYSKLNQVNAAFPVSNSFSDDEVFEREDTWNELYINLVLENDNEEAVQITDATLYMYDDEESYRSTPKKDMFFSSDNNGRIKSLPFLACDYYPYYTLEIWYTVGDSTDEDYLQINFTYSDLQNDATYIPDFTLYSSPNEDTASETTFSNDINSVNE